MQPSPVVTYTILPKDKVEPQSKTKCQLIQRRDKSGRLRWFHPTKGWRGPVHVVRA
jgi:hypothetical protein